MIEVNVTVEEDLNIGELEAELCDIAFNLRRGFDEPAIEQDMSLVGGNEEGSYLRSAHVVEVAKDAERWDRFVPRTAGFISLSERGLQDAENA